MNASDELVTLRGGVAVPIDAVLLALDLEARGCHFELDGDGLLVGPLKLLTDADREAIRRLKPHLTAIVRYVETVQ